MGDTRGDVTTNTIFLGWVENITQDYLRSFKSSFMTVYMLLQF